MEAKKRKKKIKNNLFPRNFQKFLIFFFVINRGVRVFSFIDDELQTVADLAETMELFTPLATKNVENDAAERNVKFLKDYASK